jgi:hypothetical protein
VSFSVSPLVLWLKLSLPLPAGLLRVDFVGGKGGGGGGGGGGG